MDKIDPFVCRLNSKRHVLNHKVKDRRILRTRNSLRDALLSLMREQKYESIAVKTILDRANIGRSTFYLHYAGKDELLFDGLDGLLEMLRHAQANAAPVGRHEKAIGFSSMLFQHAYENRELFKNLVGGRGWDIVRGRIEEMVILLIKEESEPFFRKKASKDISFDLFIHFLGAAFTSVLTWWMTQEKPIPPKEIDSLFREMVIPTLAAHL